MFNANYDKSVVCIAVLTWNFYPLDNPEINISKCNSGILVNFAIGGINNKAPLQSSRLASVNTLTVYASFIAV